MGPNHTSHDLTWKRPWPGASRHLSILAALMLSGALTGAQQSGEVEQLRRQLQELQQNFERMQREYRTQIDGLSNRIDQLTREAPAAGEGIKQLERELATELGAPAATVAPETSPAGTSQVPAFPLQSRSGKAYMDLGLSATFALGTSTADDIGGGTQPGGHDPNQRGFTVQGLELSASGAVDPYFRGTANLLFGMDSEGESFLEIEEAWLETFSLPANLQLRAGQLMTEFGRHNTFHPHAWGFVDSPLVLARFLGPDGLRNPGARVSWLLPTHFYSEFFFTVQNSHGETAASFRGGGEHGHGEPDTELPFAYRHPDNDRGVSGLEDLLFTPRYAASFDLTASQTVLAGVSGAFGPNDSGGSGDNFTQIYGVDLMWKWKSPRHHAGFPFVSFQAEALIRNYEAGAFDWDEDGDGEAGPEELYDLQTGAPAYLRGETLFDYGFYTQLLYGFRKGWVAGLRYDYVDGDKARYETGYGFQGESVGRDPQRAERWRLSPNLTWYPSEFSKVRLQYNYDQRHGIGKDHSIWLQFELALGAHAAHKF